ncbi:hypothetical protein LPJ53_001487 [Coemansia erecta]|uniref:Uncharacterized protein n=1 Tax=Coemansia erecta TaxID=147472 RepID=A0A9W8CUU0_9FUNG|nr:hypothetical protein LPJ53_001487 [Coemansia erecta]
MMLSQFGIKHFALASLLCLLVLETVFVGIAVYRGREVTWLPFGLFATERSQPLAVIMPVNDKTDIQFYKNMWVGDYLHPVCDFDGPDCKISCNVQSEYKTLDKKTICFTDIIKRHYRNYEFFIKLDDDALVDRGYIFELIEKYRGSSEPVYISDFILNIDNSESVLNGSYYGNGKFYMFNRALVDCIDTKMKYKGNRNEDAIFGAMVYNGCGPDVLKIPEDDSRIWHKGYNGKSVKINLSALVNH